MTKMGDNNRWFGSKVLGLGYFLFVLLVLASVVNVYSESTLSDLEVDGDPTQGESGVPEQSDSFGGGSEYTPDLEHSATSEKVGESASGSGEHPEVSSSVSSSSSSDFREDLALATDLATDQTKTLGSVDVATGSSKIQPRETASEFSFDSAVPKPSGAEMLITRNAELSIMNMFPSLDDAVELTVEDLDRYPSVELRDEKIMQEDISQSVEYYKVAIPAFNDYIGGLGTSDPRVEIGVKSNFELFVNEYQPRFERIFNFLKANLRGVDLVKVTTALFSSVTFNECKKALRSISGVNNDSEICTLISREDILSIQPEDLPKNVLKEKDEIYQLRGILLSLPFPLLTNASSLKWRHSKNSLGIYQAYSGGAIDGFAHFDFLSKKLHDMITFLYLPVFQYWDDVRIELYHGIKSLRGVLVGDNSKNVKKLMSKLALFHANWFGGSRAKKPCSHEFHELLTALLPVYEGIKEIRFILLQIRDGLNNGSLNEQDFGGVITKELLQRENTIVERRAITNSISPIFISIYNGFKSGRLRKLRRELLRVLAILEEIDFNSSVVVESQNSFKKCVRSGNVTSYFKSDLYSVKRVFYKLVKIAKQVKSDFPYPSPSSTLFIKGAKFGFKNFFKKNSARIKHGYYHEVNPFGGKSSKRSKK